MGDRLNGLSILTLGFVLYLVILSLQPPTPIGADAAADQFSAGRAEQVLRNLLGDQTPHPVGSQANAKVRDQIAAELTKLGLEPQIQRTVGCSIRGSVCANIENVVAQIPGESSDAVLIMAHYDSVPNAPGAADDGAGVAAILEAARILVDQNTFRNRVIVLLSDAEEVGLLGAQAFFTQHPWKDDVKAVINLEGSGSGGPALLLRTSPDGGVLLNAYRQVASAPVAMSASQEVFARMPNDTDFSVSNEVGIPSIDFAFSFEFNHYHTPLDTIENLDKGSLQHHGDNLLPLVQELATLDLTDTSTTFAYQSLQQSIWVSWPVDWTLMLALICLLILAAATVMLRKQYSVLHLLAGAGLTLLALICSTLICFGGIWLAGKLSGALVKFPADFGPWRLIVYSAAFLGTALVGWLAGERIGFWALFLGLWWLLAGTAIALAVTMPLAANLLLNAAILVSVLTALVAAFGDANRTSVQWLLTTLGAAALAYPLLTLAYVDEQVQGYTLAPAIYVPLLIAFLPLLPLRPGKSVVALVSIVLIAGLMWVTVAPRYSEDRPQHVTFRYVLDQDNAHAVWAASSAQPLPARITSAAESDALEAPSVPWEGYEVQTFTAPAISLGKADVDSSRTNDNVVVRIGPSLGTDYIALILPVSADISDVTLNGRPTNPRSRNEHLALTFLAPRDQPVEFGFRTQQKTRIDAYIAEGRYGLPDLEKNPADARGNLAVPQHQGDQTVSYHRLEI